MGESKKILAGTRRPPMALLLAVIRATETERDRWMQPVQDLGRFEGAAMKTDSPPDRTIENR